MSAALQSLMHDVPRLREDRAGLRELVTFVMIGGAGALAFVALSSVVIGLHTGMADWVVNTVCYAALIVPVYLLHRHFTFRSDAAHRRALPRYVAVQANAMVLATLFSFLVHGLLTLPTIFASLLVIALTSGINYLVLRSWAFAQGQLVAAASA